MMKKINSILLAVILAFSAFAITAVAQKQGDIVIIYTNDTHCQINDELSFADISAIEAIEKAKGNDVIIADAGDAIQGGTIGAISKGRYIIDIMNEVGYDVSALGNHEFDYQVPRLMELSEMADFPYISANFVRTGDGKTVFEPVFMMSIGETDIAFVSVTTPNTIASTSPEYFKDENGEYLYDFCNDSLFDVIQSNVDEASRNGADIVIALTHLGVNEADLSYTSRELISETSGIDAVIDAHSHTVLESKEHKNEIGEDVILTSTGSKFQNIGIIRISDGKITAELVDAGYKKDGIPSDGKTAYDKTDNFISDIEAECGLELEKRIAVSEAELTINNPDKYSEQTGTYREVRRSETNLGDFCADAYRDALDCDIAVINGGGVRADVEKGDVSYGDLLNVNPFGNDLCVIEVTGRQILDALEHGAKSYPDEDGAFLQVSGLSYEIDESIPSSVVLDENGIFVKVSGERRVKNVKASGKPIDEAALYTLGGSNFTLLNCGDGFSMFEGAVIKADLICTDIDALIKYAEVTLDGAIGKAYENPHGDGRIKIISESNTFSDIENHWARENIELILQRSLMNGISETEFAPELEITRGMLITILYREEGEPAVNNVIPFADVNTDDYFSNAVVWAYQNNIVDGITETEVAPNNKLTREQMAAILFRYAGYKGMDIVTPAENLEQFADRDEISKYAVTALNWAVGKNIMSGKGNGILASGSFTTRAEMATVLARLLCMPL